MDFRFLTIGDVCRDTRVFVDKLPRSDIEQRIVRIVETFGGAAAFFSATSTKLGVYSGIISKIGDDQNGSEIIKLLQAQKIDTSNIFVVQNAKTMKFITIYDKDFHRMLLYYRGRLSLKSTDIKPLVIEGYDVVCICPAPLEVSTTVAKISKDLGKILVFNPSANFVDLGLEGMKQILDKIDFFFVNECEARLYSNEDDLLKSCETIYGYGHFVLVVTRGEKGCLVYDGRKLHKIRTRPVRVVDPTGAGDSFSASFIIKYLDTEDLLQAAEFANSFVADLIKSNPVLW